jgi:hypothetical protein
MEIPEFKTGDVYCHNYDTAAHAICMTALRIFR